MTEKSKLITGLEKGEIIKSPNNYFTETEKRQIVEEYLNTDSSKIQIWRKHTGQTEEHSQLLRWIKQLGYTDKAPLSKQFTIEQKHQIIQDYLLNDLSKQDIWYRHTGKYQECGRLLKWMRKLGYEDKTNKKNTSFTSNILDMSKSKPMKESTQNTSNKALQDKIKRLEKELEEAKIKAIAYSTMIDIAEQELNIPIRKKQNTRPSKK
jgi:hypothetical protein